MTASGTTGEASASSPRETPSSGETAAGEAAAEETAYEAAVADTLVETAKAIAAVAAAAEAKLPLFLQRNGGTAGSVGYEVKRSVWGRSRH